MAIGRPACQQREEAPRFSVELLHIKSGNDLLSQDPSVRITRSSKRPSLMTVTTAAAKTCVVYTRCLKAPSRKLSVG